MKVHDTHDVQPANLLDIKKVKITRNQNICIL